MIGASPARIIRGRILSFLDEPRLAGAGALKLIEDGAVLVEVFAPPRADWHALADAPGASRWP